VPLSLFPEPLATWFQTHPTLLWAVGIFSAVSFLATLLSLPFILAKLPTDFFTDAYEHRRDQKREERPVRLWVRRVLLNTTGVVLIIAGIAMLVLPGQGILTIAVGLMLMSIPGKRRTARWLLRRPGIRPAATRLRGRFGKPPLVLDSEKPQRHRGDPVRNRR